MLLASPLHLLFLTLAFLGPPAAFSLILPLEPEKGNFSHDPSKKPEPGEIKDKAKLDNVPLDEIDQEGQPCIEGQRQVERCHQICLCVEGRFICRERCQHPLVVSTTQTPPGCHLNPSPDKCCSTLTCPPPNPPTTETKNAGYCEYKDKRYEAGQMFNDSCTSICMCGKNLQVTCHPRCPQTNQTHSDSDRCLSVQDEKDPCCTILYCDVNENEDIEDEDSFLEIHHPKSFEIMSAVAFNSTTAQLKLNYYSDSTNYTAEVSRDNSTWKPAQFHNNMIYGLSEGESYLLRVSADGIKSNIVSVSLPNSTNGSSCSYLTKSYKLGEEFYDGCSAFCECTHTGVECALIECPTGFGLDVLDPHCLAWETKPANFTPTPPHCCPETLVCKNNGSCIYKGEMFDNWADIPEKLSGCEQRCYCEAGNVTCQPRCPLVPATPPSEIRCPPSSAILAHQTDECCLQWVCPKEEVVNSIHSYYPYNQHNANGIVVHNLEAIDENTVKLVFSVPSILVGLHGRVELRYTADNKNSDPSTWEQQVLAPPNDLIATQELEFQLGDLKPGTEYKIKITVVMRDLHNSPASQILIVKTPPSGVSTTIPSVIPLEPDFKVVEVNASRAIFTWRKFSDFELQFIDGVQLRYKEIERKVYQATPLIHRAVTTYTLDDLKPESQYEVNIYFIPFPGQTTELQSHNTLTFSTKIENDPYGFELTVDVKNIKTNSADVMWSGVPYPEDMFINIYRIIYQGENGREEKSLFKVAKRDSTSGTSIHKLKTNTRYRLWLEAYLTNGKIKKSNVQDFSTSQFSSDTEKVKKEMLESSISEEYSRYYGPLVGVSVVAAIAIISTIGLLVVLARKRGHNKAPISAVTRKPAHQAAAYDNPSYKTCENDNNSHPMRRDINLDDAG